MSAGGFATAVETRCAPSAAPIPPTSSICGMQMDLNPEADHHTGSEPNPNGVFAAVAGLLAAAFFSFSSSKDPTNILYSLTAPHQRELIRTAAEFGDTTNQNYLMSAGGFATAVETRCAPSAAPIPPISNTNGSWGASSTQRPTTIRAQGPR